MKIRTIIFILFFMGCLIAEASIKLYSVNPCLKVDLRYVDKKNQEKVLRLLKTLEKVSSSILNSPSDNYCLKVYFKKQEGKQEPGFTLLPVSDKNVSVYLSISMDDLINSQKIQRKLINTFLLLKCGKPSIMIDEKEVPYWLSTALLTSFRQSQSRKFNQPNIKIYPITRNLIINNMLPDIWTIVGTKVKPQDGQIYNIYSELCDMTLNLMIFSLGRSQVLKKMKPYIIASSNSKNIKEEAFAKCFAPLARIRSFSFMGNYKSVPSTQGLSKKTTLSPQKVVEENSSSQIPEDEILSLWFNKEAPKISINCFLPADANYVSTRFNSISKIKLSLLEQVNDNRENETEPSYTERELKLEELPEYLTRIKSPELKLAKISKELLLLKIQSPTCFYDVLSNIIKAVEELSMILKLPTQSEKVSARKETIALNLKSYTEEFKIIATKQLELENYLSKEEIRYIPPVKLYKEELKVLNEIDAKNRKTNPELNNYLDSVEKEFLNN